MACSLDLVVGVNLVAILPKALDLIGLLLDDSMRHVQLIAELLVRILTDA